jgi:hypothetical protein
MIDVGDDGEIADAFYYHKFLYLPSATGEGYTSFSPIVK